MTQNKTIETEDSVQAYLDGITDENRRSDFSELVKIFSEVTTLPAKMWGTAIVGFGSYHYKYDSGREGDAPLAGLSSRANAITLYLGTDFKDRDELLSKLGKHKLSKACIYVKNLKDIDTDTLKEMIRKSVDQIKSGNTGYAC